VAAGRSERAGQRSQQPRMISPAAPRSLIKAPARQRQATAAHPSGRLALTALQPQTIRSQLADRGVTFL
jgi:hypothetical protein